MHGEYMVLTVMMFNTKHNQNQYVWHGFNWITALEEEAKQNYIELPKSARTQQKLKLPNKTIKMAK